jgi:hypothetical protein
MNKLFNVTLTLGAERIMGVVKAENMPEALQYIAREYPNYSVEAIEESFRQLL